jgi:hypothetical protein
MCECYTLKGAHQAVQKKHGYSHNPTSGFYKGISGVAVPNSRVCVLTSSGDDTCSACARLNMRPTPNRRCVACVWTASSVQLLKQTLHNTNSTSPSPHPASHLAIRTAHRSSCFRSDPAPL